MAEKLVVDVIDMSDPNLASQVLMELEGRRTNIVKLYPVCSSNALPRLIDEVIGATGGCPGSIKVLRIWGHGWLDPGGVQFIAAGPEGSLSAKTVEAMGCSVDRLRPYFVGPHARVELRACNVCKGTGTEMIKALAKRWQVRVHGSSDAQFSTQWLSPVCEATASGGFRAQAIGEPIRNVE